MQGLMMDFELTVPVMLRRAEQLFRDREIVTRLRTITQVVIPDASYLREPEHRELFLSGLRLAVGEAG